MATATSFTHTSATDSEHTANHALTNSPGERLFMIVAMGGATLGAFTGATLAAGASIPELFGLFGTLVGGVTAAAAWSLIAPLASRSE